MRTIDARHGRTARRCASSAPRKPATRSSPPRIELFVTKGWFGTGMRDVANAAGVATETLYGYFPSKRVLLQQVVDVALVGDAAPIAVAERPEFAAIGRGTHGQRAAAAARLLTAIYVRAAALAKVLREAAASDDQIADMLQRARRAPARRRCRRHRADREPRADRRRA